MTGIEKHLPNNKNGILSKRLRDFGDFLLSYIHRIEVPKKTTDTDQNALNAP